MQSRAPQSLDQNSIPRDGLFRSEAARRAVAAGGHAVEVHGAQG